MALSAAQSERVEFLCAAARAAGPARYYLNSHYMMRCKAIISNKSEDLQKQLFKSHIRCARCCVEWTKGKYDTKILPLKSNKNLRKRMRRALKKDKSKETQEKVNAKLHSNALERLCHFCNNKTIITTLKPASIRKEQVKTPDLTAQHKISTPKISSKKHKTINIQKHSKKAEKQETNIYYNSKAVFTTNFAKNNQKEELQAPKKAVNKRKRDKFAGLCKEAVLASAKAKDIKKINSNNKLNLFLKPSL